MLGYLSRRFVIVAGKGGVGKSTVCAALGLAAARAGKRTIIAELNTREKAPLYFGKPESGYDAVEIHDNLYSINIQPEPALREYGLMKLRFERIFKLVFENEAMRRLIKMIPGMNELFLLGKAFNMERERDKRGQPVWDLIIVDAPATGHGVSLLRLPDVILAVSESGAMADEVRAMKELLTDPKRTMMQIVTLPEEMPVRETQELTQQLQHDLRIPPGYLFVNGVWPSVIDAEGHAISQALAASSADPRVDGAASILHRFVTRRALQDGYLDELARTIPFPSVHIPYLFTREFAFDAIDAISGHVARQMAAHEGVAWPPEAAEPDDAAAAAG